MLLEIADFRRRVDRDMDGLIADLSALTERGGEEERKAWRNSLPVLASVLAVPLLQPYHLQLGQGGGGVAVEYRLPGSGSWCDAVLLGRGPSKPSAVILELKDWETSGDRPGPVESLMDRQGRLAHHPSDQVRGYTEYARHFHSTVQTTGANVAGCVFFTRAWDATAYAEPPNDQLVGQYPLFTFAADDREQNLPEFLARYLSRPDPEFARAFDAGTYRQDRNFVQSVARAMVDSKLPQLVLLDQQRQGLARCRFEIQQLLSGASGGRKVVLIVEGPPGSGKSALAAKLWTELVQDRGVDGNVVFVTTSGCQKTNWEAIFKAASRRKGAAGIVFPVNRFNPGLTSKWVASQQKLGLPTALGDWKRHLASYLASGRGTKSPDDMHAVSIVDEAHSLINPAAPGAEGAPPSGWVFHAGPQAWHVIRASKVSAFFMDAGQSYRDNETTTATDIRRWAGEFGAEVTDLSLAGAQFRCGGSAGYVDWVEDLLAIASKSVTTGWRRTEAGGAFEFELAASPTVLEARLRERARDGRTARLLASYARAWKTKQATAPHDLPPDQKDFFIQDPAAASGVWSRPWNFAPDGDYTLYIQAPERSHMHADPLSEVGCPYVVRGFDFDYVGLLWLSDLVWRGNRWVAQLEHVHESAWPKTKARARKAERAGRPSEELVARLARGYRILLTRALRGTHVWFEDAETREHVEAALRGEP